MPACSRPEWLRRRAAAFFVLSLALFLPACDSDDNGGEESDLTGVYTFQALRFVPQSSLLAPLSVLDRAGNAEMRFFPDDEEFSLIYEFPNDDGEVIPRRIDGEYDADGGEVRLNVDGNAANRQRLLLPDEFTLSVNGSELSGEIELDNVNLTSFSDEYSGIGEVDGVLEILLSQQQGAQQ